MKVGIHLIAIAMTCWACRRSEPVAGSKPAGLSESVTPLSWKDAAGMMESALRNSPYAEEYYISVAMDLHSRSNDFLYVAFLKTRTIGAYSNDVEEGRVGSTYKIFIYPDGSVEVSSKEIPKLVPAERVHPKRTVRPSGNASGGGGTPGPWASAALLAEHTLAESHLAGRMRIFSIRCSFDASGSPEFEALLLPAEESAATDAEKRGQYAIRIGKDNRAYLEDRATSNATQMNVKSRRRVVPAPATEEAK